MICAALIEGLARAGIPIATKCPQIAAPAAAIWRFARR
jgi:hypothetical protein